MGLLLLPGVAEWPLLSDVSLFRAANFIPETFSNCSAGQLLRIKWKVLPYGIVSCSFREEMGNGGRESSHRATPSALGTSGSA